MKILSPAGNFESLKVAIYNGADEVYLGINDFNARNNIDGFTMENLKEAVDFAHLYGVKVLLAINILFADEEMQSALDTVVDAYNLGVDAFIVQDLGLISLISKNYPLIEIHASTQMGLHNLEGVREVAKHGVKRVVLARETPLDEIKRIKDNLDIEIEYFAHGALCVSFSGNCYLSSHLFSASGNRGRCKQLCRLPYSFLDGEKELKKGYLLSAKDFNMLARLKDLESAGVDVLKIEGRARRPYYVGAITKAYKQALTGQKVDKTDIELAFNRTFTEGYFNGNGKIISEIQNHIGALIGRVERVKNGKNFNEIYISSSQPLSPKSTFKFFNGNKENNTLTAFDLKEINKGQYKLTTTQSVNPGDSVRLIMDAQKENYVKESKLKRQISLRLEFLQNQNARADFLYNDKHYIIEGEKCLPALNSPLLEQEIKDNFSKSENFSASLDITLDKAFMPKKQLNEFRRTTFEKIYQIITANERKALQKIKLNKAEKVKEFKLDNALIYSPEEYVLQDILNKKVECENSGRDFYLDTPNFALNQDIILLKEIVEKAGAKIVANNYYALSINAQKIIGYGLNVYNNYTASEYDLPFVRAENNQSFTPPFMTLRHCPIKAHLGGECKNCKFHDGYKYKMDGGKTFSLKRKKLSTCIFYIV